MLEEAGYSETSVQTQKTTRHHVAECGYVRGHRHGILRPPRVKPGTHYPHVT